MSRYIDAEDAKARFCGWKHERSICEEIDAVETVDAVPVVRCKDCKFAHLTYDKEVKYCGQWGTDEALYLDGDFFCAFGEKVTK